MGLESQRPTPAGASFIDMQAPRPVPVPGKGLSRVPRASKSRSVAGRISGCGPACRKGPCFSHARPAPQLTRCPSFYLFPPSGRLPPHLLRQPVAPEGTQASLSGPGSRGRHLATPGGRAFEMGSWLQDSPPPPAAGPEHSPPFSALPHCLIVTEALHQPSRCLCHSAQGKVHGRVCILALTPACLLHSQPRSLGT